MESDSWVNVIPITADREVVLIRQYRHGIREVTLEIPGGIVEPHDSPKEAARRELQEETWYEAGEMVGLCFVHPNPAFLDIRCYTFLAQDARRTRHQAQDEKEDIEVLLKSLAEIARLIRSVLVYKRPFRAVKIRRERQKEVLFGKQSWDRCSGRLPENGCDVIPTFVKR